MLKRLSIVEKIKKQWTQALKVIFKMMLTWQQTESQIKEQNLKQS